MATNAKAGDSIPTIRRARRIKPTVDFSALLPTGAYAAAWWFKVSSAFRSAMDIQYTVRKKTACWTQGNPPLYAFRAHDLFTTWDANERFALRVTQDRPDKLKRVGKAKVIERGDVGFDLLIKGDDGHYEFLAWFSCKQSEFAELLRTGQLCSCDIDLTVDPIRPIIETIVTRLPPAPPLDLQEPQQTLTEQGSLF